MTSSNRHDFLVAQTDKQSKKRSTCVPRYARGDNISYYLPVNGHRKKVCKPFLLSTLSISSKMVHYNVGKVAHGVRQPPPTKVAHNKMADGIHTAIREHIMKFPKVESHYCRVTTKHEYLEPLNSRQMLRMFKEDHPELNTSETFHRKVFNEELTLGFHKASSDMCDACDQDS